MSQQKIGYPAGVAFYCFLGLISIWKMRGVAEIDDTFAGKGLPDGMSHCQASHS